MDFLTDRACGKFPNRGRKGQVTVFLSLILLGVILLAAVLVDLSRISSGRELAKSAVNSAARSVLAEYGTKLSDNYGLFALPESDSNVLASEIKDYISKNLTISRDSGEYGERLDLYGFRVEDVKVTPLFNLSENEVIKRQALEYMKYRAPKELVEGFLDRLTVFGKAGKMSEAYKKKVEADKLLGKMDKSQQALKKKVDGDGKPGGVFVNGFNAGGKWMQTFDRFSSLSSGLNSLRESLSELDGSIEEVQASMAAIANAGGGGNGDNTQGGGQAEKAALAKMLQQLLMQRQSISASLSQMQSSFNSIWNDLRYSLTGEYEKPVAEAADEVNKIVEAGKNAQVKLDELEAYMKDNLSDTDSLSSDFVSTTKEEIQRLKGLILSGSKAEEILGGLGGDQNVLNGLADSLDQIKSSTGGASGYSIPVSLTKGIGDMLAKYANINYSYEKPQKEAGKTDPRAGVKEEAERTLLDEFTSDKNYLDEGIKATDLPSNTKEPSYDFKKEDAPYLNGGAENSSTADKVALEASYPGDLEKIGESADLYDEEGNFAENALGFIGDIGKIAAGSIEGLRDNVYLNEYIMGIFKNSVPALADGTGTTTEDKDFGGEAKSGRDTFYQGEVEYILHGEPSENANKLMTRGQILLVRFGLDTLHVYTDARMREEATGIAAAVAGWWTGGAGIPILANLIMYGWGMGEAVIDVTDLLEGKSVPIYKLQGDWKLDIGLGKSSRPKADPRLCFSYYDYLRLFLLGMNEEDKLNRMEDLIQLNMGMSKDGFRMTGCKTAIRVEAVVSIKNLFLNRAFVPASVRTEDGRHKFSILVYEGY